MSKIEISISEYERLKHIETVAGKVYQNRDKMYPLDEAGELEFIRYANLVRSLGRALIPERHYQELVERGTFTPRIEQI